MKNVLTLDVVLCRVHLLQDGDGVRASLSGAVLGPRQDVPPAERDRDGGLLNRRRLLPSLLEDSHEEFTCERECACNSGCVGIVDQANLGKKHQKLKQSIIMNHGEFMN